MVGDPALIRRFPHQTWNASLRFDQETGDHAACLWGVRSLFLTSLTRGAATTDGVHALTDTALAEALVLLRAMELVADGDTSLLLQNTTIVREFGVPPEPCSRKGGGGSRIWGRGVA
jgi:hypothetical protein